MIVAFDIETVPDFEFGRKLYGLEGIEDREVAKAMLAARRTKVPDADFLPLHQQQIIAISVAARWDENKFMIRSLGRKDSEEKSIVKEFFRAIDKAPNLVTWNGSGFDLPVLNYRALRYGIQSRVYWDTGETNQEFRWNNYHNRYHKRHVDLMDMLARYQGRAFAGLDEVSKLIGLPGKIGIGGGKVLDAYLEGRIQEIRDYCDIDTLNTYLIYLRFKYIQRGFTVAQYRKELNITKKWLDQRQEPYLREYREGWNEFANFEQMT